MCRFIEDSFNPIVYLPTVNWLCNKAETEHTFTTKIALQNPY